MRLLDVHTLELHEFQGADIPKYAILSHTWAEEEVSLQDLQAGRGPGKAGYEKIERTCNQARRHKLRWAWVDTCCIDKTSSAELSEAINSMYQWYKESDTCYAYLSDVDYQFRDVGIPEEIQVSRWFTRAWTLQELIAPRKFIFYDRQWREIGHRSQEDIATAVCDATRIPREVIQGVETLDPYSVAQKMSWAAHRSSTRVEDRAYSLIGLFDINMPLLYGEGDKAFKRLQEEILKETDDHSLLCWTVPKDSPRAWTLQSVFAKSPDDFSGSGNIRGNLFDWGAPSAMTNRGLQLRLDIKARNYGQNSHLYSGNPACYTYDAPINASVRTPGGVVIQLSIILVRTPQLSPSHSQSVNRYARLATPVLGRTEMRLATPVLTSNSIGEAYLTELMLAVRSSEELYIHKNLFSWEHGRFGAGGIHLQNIPISEELCHLRPLLQEDPDHGYEIRKVFFSGLKTAISSTDPYEQELIGQKMMWSPIYGCIVFGDQFREAPNSNQSEANVQFATFSMESYYNTPCYILIAWDEELIHFSVRQGRFRREEFRVAYYLISGQYITVNTAEEMLEMRAKLLDRSDPATHKGNYRNIYGEIARTRTVLGSYDTEFVLEREDPNTVDGEAAGNRMHFLVRASFSKIQATEPKKSLVARLKGAWVGDASI
ncbi:hypothetical protein Hte_008689 [Hypoxylon texense]